MISKVEIECYLFIKKRFFTHNSYISQTHILTHHNNSQTHILHASFIVTIFKRINNFSHVTNNMNRYPVNRTLPFRFEKEEKKGRKKRKGMAYLSLLRTSCYTISATLLLRQRYYNAMQLSKQQLTNFLFPVCSDNINHFPSSSL